MTLLETDHGIRCDNHVGEAFRVRCYDCDAAATEDAVKTRRASERGECALHPGYPTSALWPCARCLREAR